MLLGSRGGKFLSLLGLIFIDMVSPTTIVTSRLIISFLILIISLFLLKPTIRFKDHQELFNIISRSAEFGFSEILAMIYANIDVAILTFYSISETGLYSPASGIIHALFIIPNSLFVYLLPQYARQFEKTNNFLLRKISKRIWLIFSLIGLVLSVGLFISGELIVTFLLGTRFMATSSVIRILSPIMFFKSMAFGSALLIVITGHQRKRLLPQLFVSCFNIILNILLIPNFGLIGVAWIYTLSELLLMLSYFQIANKVINNEKTQRT
jgi:O-antigen/teichoic acid export membrane protein